MKLRHLAGMLAVAILAAMLVAYAKNASDRGDYGDRIRACQIVGEVADDCTELVPSIEECHKEDCSDIRGRVGYWRDNGKLWLRETPETVIRPQGMGA